jgi:hypothetical protein
MVCESDSPAMPAAIVCRRFAPTRVRYRCAIEDQVEAVGEPRQPARDEVIALAGGHVRAAAAEQQTEVVAQDLHRAKGPARALLLEIEEVVRHDAAAVARRATARRC